MEPQGVEFKTVLNYFSKHKYLNTWLHLAVCIFGGMPLLRAFSFLNQTSGYVLSINERNDYDYALLIFTTYSCILGLSHLGIFFSHLFRNIFWIPLSILGVSWIVYFDWFDPYEVIVLFPWVDSGLFRAALGSTIILFGSFLFFECVIRKFLNKGVPGIQHDQTT